MNSSAIRVKAHLALVSLVITLVWGCGGDVEVLTDTPGSSDGETTNLRETDRVSSSPGSNTTSPQNGGESTDTDSPSGDLPGSVGDATGPVGGVTSGDGGNTTAPVDGTNFGGQCTGVTDCANADTNPAVVCLAGIDGGYCTVGCDVDAVCGSTAVCALAVSETQRFCALDCSAGQSCGRADLTCDPAAGACVGEIETNTGSDDLGGFDDLFGDLGAGGVGGSCSADTECSVGYLSDNRCFTAAQGWPGGYCAGYGCADDYDCDSLGFGICVGATTTDTGVCLEACFFGCSRAGYECIPIDEWGTGVCIPETPYPSDPSNVGVGCVFSDQCTTGSGNSPDQSVLCVPPRWPDGEAGWPDGYCSALDCRQNSCGSGAVCVTMGTDDPINLCLQTCSAPGGQSTCRTGYSCDDLDGTIGVCRPAS